MNPHSIVSCKDCKVLYLMFEKQKIYSPRYSPTLQDVSLELWKLEQSEWRSLILFNYDLYIFEKVVCFHMKDSNRKHWLVSMVSWPSGLWLLEETSQSVETSQPTQWSTEVKWLGQWMWGYCRPAAAHRAFWT